MADSDADLVGSGEMATTDDTVGGARTASLEGTGGAWSCCCCWRSVLIRSICAVISCTSCCCWSWPATASCRRGRAAPSRHRPPLRPWTSSCHRVAEPSKRRWRIHSLMLMVQLPMLMLMPLSKRVSPPSCSQRWKAEWVQARAACRSSQERPRPRASRTCSRSPGRAPPSSASCCSHMHEESARQTHTSSSCSFAC